MWLAGASFNLESGQISQNIITMELISIRFRVVLGISDAREGPSQAIFDLFLVSVFNSKMVIHNKSASGLGDFEYQNIFENTQPVTTLINETIVISSPLSGLRLVHARLARVSRRSRSR